MASPATFRPPLRNLGPFLLLGGVGGAVVGGVFEIPILLGALFGALAAWIAASVHQLGGVRAVASADGLRVTGPGAAPVEARWSELRVGFGAVRCGETLQRYAIVADPVGRSFAFADLSGARAAACDPVRGADGRTVPVTDLREAPFLLALVVQRTPAWNVLPVGLQEAAGGPAASPLALSVGRVAAEVEGSRGERGEPSAIGQSEAAPARRERATRVGLVGLVLKLGGKLLGAAGKIGAGALKALKTANVGWAAASVASYSLLFSWKFAIAIMLQLFVHEYGHVHAMRKSGMRVRGMYFIPFLGALAVTDDAFRSRREQAYVALSGPIWGSLFALVPAGLYLWTGQPIFAAIASWWALINLFNLLPITPLDGGRVLHAFASSFSSSLGLAVSVLGLAGAVALGASLGFSLIYFIAALGAMELIGEAQARAGARALRLLPEPARFGAAHYAYLRAVAGPPPGSPSEGLFLRGLERQQRAARSEPMRAGQLARWGLAYAALAAGLVLLVYLMRAVPGAEAAARFLR